MFLWLTVRDLQYKLFFFKSMFTCAWSWRALKAAGFYGSGLVASTRSPPSQHPRPLLPPPAPAGSAGRTVGVPPLGRLHPGHRETWQPLWKNKIKWLIHWNYIVELWKTVSQTSSVSLLPVLQYITLMVAYKNVYIPKNRYIQCGEEKVTTDLNNMMINRIIGKA